MRTARVILSFDKVERTVCIILIGPNGAWISERLRTEDDFLEALGILEEEGVFTPEGGMELMEAASELDLPEGEASPTLKEGMISFCRTRKEVFQEEEEMESMTSTFLAPQPRLIM